MRITSSRPRSQHILSCNMRYTNHWYWDLFVEHKVRPLPWFQRNLSEHVVFIQGNSWVTDRWSRGIGDILTEPDWYLRIWEIIFDYSSRTMWGWQDRLASTDWCTTHNRDKLELSDRHSLDWEIRPWDVSSGENCWKWCLVDFKLWTLGWDWWTQCPNWFNEYHDFIFANWTFRLPLREGWLVNLDIFTLGYQDIAWNKHHYAWVEHNKSQWIDWSFARRKLFPVDLTWCTDCWNSQSLSRLWPSTYLDCVLWKLVDHHYQPERIFGDWHQHFASSNVTASRC